MRRLIFAAAAVAAVSAAGSLAASRAEALPLADALAGATATQAEQVRLVNLLIERVQLLSDGVDIVWRESGWRELAGELSPDTIGGELLEIEVAS